MDLIEIKKSAKKLVDLIGADVVVAVGRGISSNPTRGIEIAEELANVLGGVVGASRAVVDAGFEERLVLLHVHVQVGAVRRQAGVQPGRHTGAQIPADVQTVLEHIDVQLSRDDIHVDLIEIKKSAKKLVDLIGLNRSPVIP